MKGKKTFLFVWAVLVFTLSTVLTAAANGNNWVPTSFAIYAQDSRAYTTPDYFSTDVKEYTADIPFKTDTVTLRVWGSSNEGTSDVAITVEVKKSETVWETISNVKNTADGLFASSAADSVYIVPLGKNVNDKVTGRVSFLNPQTTKRDTFILTAVRVNGIGDATLRELFVTKGTGTTAGDTLKFNPAFVAGTAGGTVENPKKYTDTLSLKVTNVKDFIVAELRKGLSESDTTGITTNGDTVKITAATTANIDALQATIASLAATGRSNAVTAARATASAGLLLHLDPMDAIGATHEVHQWGKNDALQPILFNNNPADIAYRIGLDSVVTIRVTSDDGAQNHYYSVITHAKVEAEVVVKIVKTEGDGSFDVDLPDAGTDGFGPRVADIWLEDSKGNKFATDSVFHQDTLSYTAGVPAAASLSLVWASASIEPGLDFRTFSFPGDTPVYQLSVLKNGTLVTDYRISTYVLSSDAALGAFRASADSLGKEPIDGFSPAFDFDSLSYSLKVHHDTDTIYLFVPTRNESATVALNLAGFPSEDIKQLKGDSLWLVKLGDPGQTRDIRVVVTAADKTVRTYTVNIFRRVNMYLSQLSLTANDSGIPLTPQPNLNSVFHYRALVPEGVVYDAVRITAVAHGGVESGVTVTTALVERVDSSFFRIKTWYGTDSHEYIITLFRPDSSAFLKFLAVAPGTLVPDFNPEVFDYSVELKNEEDRIAFVTFHINDKLDDSYIKGAGQHPAATGDSIYTITVTAENDVTKKDYRIRVHRAWPTGISPVAAGAVKVYADASALHISTPSAERVNIYSVAGKLLHSFDKAAGEVSPAVRLPRGILIVKGSTGWIGKVIL